MQIDKLFTRFSKTNNAPDGVPMYLYCKHSKSECKIRISWILRDILSAYVRQHDYRNTYDLPTYIIILLSFKGILYNMILFNY